MIYFNYVSGSDLALWVPVWDWLTCNAGKLSVSDMPKVSLREPIHQDLKTRYPNLNTSEAVACALYELSYLRLLIEKTIGMASVQVQSMAVQDVVAEVSSTDD